MQVKMIPFFTLRMYFAITLLEKSRHICFVLNKQYFPSTIYRPAQNIYVSVYVQLRARREGGALPPYILSEKPVPWKNLVRINDCPPQWLFGLKKSSFHYWRAPRGPRGVKKSHFIF